MSIIHKCVGVFLFVGKIHICVYNIYIYIKYIYL